MKTCVVTGAAGFIGSHLCEALLADGWAVRGIDAFIPYYPESWKRRNLRGLEGRPGFALHTLDLRNGELRPVLDGAETVIHLAAMPGLRRSWSEFDLYASCNLNATQRLLEAADAAGIRHFIHGSTSSVYGADAAGAESSPLRPVSPYGVTKLAAEHLCRAYQDIRGLPLTVLRFFSVYGPRQRPDMAYTILIDALLNGKPFPRYGDGTQTRSNTFVADCVQGIALTARHPDRAVGQTWNPRRPNPNRNRNLGYHKTRKALITNDLRVYKTVHFLNQLSCSISASYDRRQAQFALFWSSERWV
jgi:UDP-glucuronate 4-epimerase